MKHIQLGKRIRKARENKGYSQGELASKIGVKAETIERWEADVSAPRVNKLSTISGILNVPLLWLLAGAENLPETETQPNKLVLQEKLDQAEQGLMELNALLGEVRVLVENLKEEQS